MSSSWETPPLAQFGNGIPHFNFSFHEQSNEFNPYRSSYQEVSSFSSGLFSVNFRSITSGSKLIFQTLLFYSLLPMSLLLLLLLVYLFYFCARDWTTTTTSSTKCFPSMFCSSITLSLYSTFIIAIIYRKIVLK